MWWHNTKSRTTKAALYTLWQSIQVKPTSYSCKFCKLWTHSKCTITISQYISLKTSDVTIFCLTWKEWLPILSDFRTPVPRMVMGRVVSLFRTQGMAKTPSNSWLMWNWNNQIASYVHISIWIISHIKFTISKNVWANIQCRWIVCRLLFSMWIITCIHFGEQTEILKVKRLLHTYDRIYFRSALAGDLQKVLEFQHIVYIGVEPHNNK